MSYFPNGLPPPQIDGSGSSAYRIYEQLSDIPENEKATDIIYYIRSENKYYIYDSIKDTFVFVMDIIEVSAIRDQVMDNTVRIGNNYDNINVLLGFHNDTLGSIETIVTTVKNNKLEIDNKVVHIEQYMFGLSDSFDAVSQLIVANKESCDNSINATNENVNNNTNNITNLDTRLTQAENNIHGQYMDFDERIFVLNNKCKWLEAGDNIEILTDEINNTIKLRDDLKNINNIEVLNVDMNNMKSVLNIETLDNIFRTTVWPDINNKVDMVEEMIPPLERGLVDVNIRIDNLGSGGTGGSSKPLVSNELIINGVEGNFIHKNFIITENDDDTTIAVNDDAFVVNQLQGNTVSLGMFNPNAPDNNTIVITDAHIMFTKVGNMRYLGYDAVDELLNLPQQVSNYNYIALEAYNALPGLRTLIDTNTTNINNKQNKLTAGENIKIENNVIDAIIPSNLDDRLNNLEEVNSYNPSKLCYNAPNAVYSFDWVMTLEGTSLRSQQEAWSNVFWNIRDIVYVSCIVRVKITDPAFNVNNGIQIKLPFKMLSSSQGNTNQPFGTAFTTQRGATFRCYGGIWDHKLFDVVSVSNYNNSDFYSIYSPYTLAGDVGSIYGSDVYNRTFQYQVSFYYKAKWPLERVM